MYTHSLARISILPYGEGCVTRFFLAVALATAFFFIGSEYAFAQSSKFELSQERIIIREDEYGEYEDYVTEIIHTIEDGGEYAVILNEEYDVYIYSEETPNTDGGYLYRINDEGQREFVEILGGYEGASQWSWETPGTYELDVYEMEPLILTERTPLQRILDWVVGYAVHAQSPDRFVETMHFTITDQNAPAECCSSVVFLPGIKGSVLKKDRLLTEDTLWPPTIWSDDVSELALDEEGNSIEDVFVDGLLNTFKGVSVYGGFSSYMDELVGEGLISEWQSLPYDWRFSPEHTIQEGIQTRDEVINVIEKIERIAEDSSTKKVTIIAHSMGGIFGKAIIKELEDQGKEGLIDSFVMVGSPQLGTPQAIPSLLHGHDEGIGFGFIVSARITRFVAQNMSSVYDLLPSSAYFDAIAEPVVMFDGEASFTDEWKSVWGNSIDTYSELKDFLAGETVPRDVPAIYDLSSPSVLDADLISGAESLHENLDSYQIPENIRTVQLAGWGIPTVKSTVYKNRHVILNAFEPVFTVEGDKTVVSPSAVSSDGESYYLNLFEYNEQLNADIQHRDLLNAQSIQDVIRQIVLGNQIENIDNISSNKPNTNDITRQLLISTHSPVVLGVYDEEGRFTGIDQDQNLESDFLEIKEEIPSSTFIVFGESQFIFLPEEGEYTFVYKGTGNGSTTVEIDAFVDDSATNIASYTDIPTTEQTEATFELDSTRPNDVQIQVDQNGDGSIDTFVLSDQEQEEPEQTLDELLHDLTTKVQVLDISRGIKNKLLIKIVVIEKTAKVKHVFLQKLFGRVGIKAFESDIRSLKKKNKISTEEGSELLDILNKIKKYYE
jgi:hypothetical protein